MKKLLIVGDSEIAEIAAWYFARDYHIDTQAFVVEEGYAKRDNIKGIKIISFNDLKEYPPEDYCAFVAVGIAQLNRLRQRLYEKIKGLGYALTSYVSPNVYLDKHATIGENCFIFENNVIQYNVKIGNNVVLWSGNHIGHSTVIEDHVFIASHAAISGYCNIGHNCYLGTNCTLGNNVKIGEDTIIGAGAVITHDALPGKVYKNKKAVADERSSYEIMGLNEQCCK